MQKNRQAKKDSVVSKGSGTGSGIMNVNYMDNFFDNEMNKMD